jgi:hypothetical protein
LLRGLWVCRVRFLGGCGLGRGDDRNRDSGGVRNQHFRLTLYTRFIFLVWKDNLLNPLHLLTPLLILIAFMLHAYSDSLCVKGIIKVSSRGVYCKDNLRSIGACLEPTTNIHRLYDAKSYNSSYIILVIQHFTL